MARGARRPPGISKLRSGGEGPRTREREMTERKSPGSGVRGPRVRGRGDAGEDVLKASGRAGGVGKGRQETERTAARKSPWSPWRWPGLYPEQGDRCQEVPPAGPPVQEVGGNRARKSTQRGPKSPLDRTQGESPGVRKESPESPRPGPGRVPLAAH